MLLVINEGKHVRTLGSPSKMPATMGEKMQENCEYVLSTPENLWW